MLKEISVIAVAITFIGVSSLQAKEVGTVNTTQQIQAVNADGDISRSDAKKIVKAYLKSNKAYKKLKVGKVVKEQDNWKVLITTNRNARVLTSFINDKTGEITIKQ